jgi:2-polyprenyl-3-methyl-5-hydroxy-6-metoxy-1,4-benzoquinol methylase
MPDQITGILSPFFRSRRIAASRPFLQGRVLDIGCGAGHLTRHVEPARYVGVDQDVESIAIARKKFPNYVFLTTANFSNSHQEQLFDVIIGLAVIEHIMNPEEWLTWLRTLIVPGGRLVLTTPHPAMRSVHEWGARIGIFSRKSAEEHQEFFNQQRMANVARATRYRIALSRRFLLGANQLFVLEPV